MWYRDRLNIAPQGRDGPIQRVEEELFTHHHRDLSFFGICSFCRTGYIQGDQAALKTGPYRHFCHGESAGERGRSSCRGGRGPRSEERRVGKEGRARGVVELDIRIK